MTALSMLAGFLIGTSYIPFPPWALFFCLTPLLVAWSEQGTPKQALWGGWLAQFILNAIGFHWVAHTAYEFGHLPLALSWLTLVLFCATAHLYYPAAGFAMRWLARRRPLSRAGRIFLAAALLLLFEEMFPALFPWHFGYPWLWAGWPGAQTADVIGFAGLNVATVGANALLAWAWIERGHWRKAAGIAAVAAALILALNAWGVERKKAWATADSELDVLAVQGNVGNYEKMYAQQGPAYQADILARYERLTRAGFARYPEAQAALWPETAFPDNLDRVYLEGANQRALRAFAQETGRTIFTGAFSEDRLARAYYNGFFAIDPSGQPIGDGYRKTVLLAFGEYFPGSQWFPFIFKWIPSISNFGRGLGPMAMMAAGTQIGPQICYEGLYPQFTAGLARAGAQVILNVTNDSWFGDGFEPRQHLYMTLARAIEFRRPLLRATNTGISTAILANGDVLQKSPQNEEWYGLFRIKYRSRPETTVYQKLLDACPFFWAAILALGAALLLVFAHEGKSRA